MNRHTRRAAHKTRQTSQIGVAEWVAISRDGVSVEEALAPRHGLPSILIPVPAGQIETPLINSTKCQQIIAAGGAVVLAFQSKQDAEKWHREVELARDHQPTHDAPAAVQ